jgi:hypothetical protein
MDEKLLLNESFRRAPVGSLTAVGAYTCDICKCNIYVSSEVRAIQLEAGKFLPHTGRPNNTLYVHRRCWNRLQEHYSGNKEKIAVALYNTGIGGYSQNLCITSAEHFMTQAFITTAEEIRLIYGGDIIEEHGNVTYWPCILRGNSEVLEETFVYKVDQDRISVVRLDGKKDGQRSDRARKIWEQLMIKGKRHREELQKQISHETYAWNPKATVSY